MAEVRKYRFAVHTGCGKSLIDCTCASGAATTGKIVSATDDRDVQPLVEAARQALLANNPFVRAECHRRIEDALQPFEEAGEKS